MLTFIAFAGGKKGECNLSIRFEGSRKQCTMALIEVKGVRGVVDIFAACPPPTLLLTYVAGFDEGEPG
jgi:hypothetical protein